jgi:hypothetical protein
MAMSQPFPHFFNSQRHELFIAMAHSYDTESQALGTALANLENGTFSTQKAAAHYHEVPLSALNHRINGRGTRAQQYSKLSRREAF